MLRFTKVASLVGCLLIAPAALLAGDGSSQPPSQAMVRINAAGELELCATLSKAVTEEMTEEYAVTVMKPETKTRAMSVVRYVSETVVQKFPPGTTGFRRDADQAEIPLFDLAGNRMSVTAAESRLHDWTLVLISQSGKPLDRKFANLFKPTTVVVGMPPQAAIAIPAYPAPQAPVTVPPRPIPQPVPAPTTSRERQPALTPVAFLADAAPPQLPNSPQPTFAYAKVWGEKTLALRTESEKTVNVTSMVNREVEKIHDGKPVKVVVCEPKVIEKTVEIRETVRHPLAEVSVTRMPNKELAKSELPSVLAAETLAMVSADGKPVDLLWQRNLRDGVLVIVAPMVPAAAPFPVGAPTYSPSLPVAPGRPAEIPPPAAPQTVPPRPGE